MNYVPFQPSFSSTPPNFPSRRRRSFFRKIKLSFLFIFSPYLLPLLYDFKNPKTNKKMNQNQNSNVNKLIFHNVSYYKKGKIIP